MENAGVYDGTALPFIPAPTYHACRSRISRGQLWTLHRKSPAHLKAELDNPKPPTQAMLRGSAMHTAVLEPARFLVEYLVPSDVVLACDRRTKDGRALFDEWLGRAKAEKRIPLGWDPEESRFYRDDVVTVLTVAEKLARDPALSRLLREGEGQTEATYCWDEDRSRFRIRFDRVNRTRAGWVAIDLKSSSDARLGAMQRSLVDYGLHFQAGMYSDGFKACRDEELRGFYFLVYETEPPYAHAFFRSSEDVLEAGRFEYRAAVAALRLCQETDQWPGYESLGIQELGLPSWYK